MVHFAGGDHGLEARDKLNLRVIQLETKLAKLTFERKFYEHRIALLEKGNVSADIADELARKNLQYAHPQDLILFEWFFSLKAKEELYITNKITKNVIAIINSKNLY